MLPEQKENMKTQDRHSLPFTQEAREWMKHPGLTAVYFILRLAVIIVLIRQLVQREYYDAFLCALTLFLFMIPSFVEKRLDIDVPNVLEVIILLFIFASEILGEIDAYYETYPYWDSMLHIMNGFLMAAIGFALIDILNSSERCSLNLSPVFVALTAFCFSMTVGVLWEFFEYGMDLFFLTDMQKDSWISLISSVDLNPNSLNDPLVVTVDNLLLNGYALPQYLDIGLRDTMGDLFVNFIGATVFSAIGYLYLKGRGSGGIIKRFVPRRKERGLAQVDASSLIEYDND